MFGDLDARDLNPGKPGSFDTNHEVQGWFIEGGRRSEVLVLALAGARFGVPVVGSFVLRRWGGEEHSGRVAFAVV